MKTGEGFKPVVVGKTILHIIGANESVTLTPIELMLNLKDNNTIIQVRSKEIWGLNDKISNYWRF
ncbi:hypothetical protein [Bacillus sp. ok061]|uniref:hypothetical protein n=1 Tax=Bacillus sp. ok061 TaxID=1761766 RepID=UPI000CDE9D9E|nr:hypothetical protein [Bacillus sp. ok061]